MSLTDRVTDTTDRFARVEAAGASKGVEVALAKIAMCPTPAARARSRPRPLGTSTG